MLPKATNLFAQSRIARIMVRLFTIAIFVGCLAMSQASVKAVTVWSDAWVDDSNPDQAFIVGCGVTEATYDDDWGLQSVKVTVTLRSPNGRTATLNYDGAYQPKAAGSVKKNFSSRNNSTHVRRLNFSISFSPTL